MVTYEYMHMKHFFRAVVELYRATQQNTWNRGTQAEPWWHFQWSGVVQSIAIMYSSLCIEHKL